MELLQNGVKHNPICMGFWCQDPIKNKILFSLGVQQENGIRENCNVLGLDCDKPNQKMSPKIGSCVGKKQKNLNVRAFFQDSSGRRCRSSTVDHRAGNRLWRRWLPEMKNGDISIFVSSSRSRIHSPNSPISILNPLMRLNPQEPLRT